jgi:hypothetical protein
MKKSMLVALVMAFLTFMASSSGFAQTAYTGIADTSKEGSLLVWPLIQTNDGNETYIIITNSLKGTTDNETTDHFVDIKCYWEFRQVPSDPSYVGYCGLSDMVFQLSANNPLIFKASDGAGLDGRGLVPGIGTGVKGALKCWAVDPADTTQIAWNHLSGYAIIVDSDNATMSAVPQKSAWQYSAWRFAANILDQTDNATYADGFWVGKSIEGGDAFNQLKLTGANKLVIANSATPSPCPARTTPIKVKSSFDPNTGSPIAPYTYYCVSTVNPANCPWPFTRTGVNGCDIAAAVYDACPKYLTFDFLSEPSSPSGTDGWAFNHLALLPCKEDLRSDADAFGLVDFPTRLSFSVWNENETKYTGTQYCANCDKVNLGQKYGSYQRYLAEIFTGQLNFFQAKTLHTSSGRFRVEGLAGGICSANTDYGILAAQKTPLIGVMSTRILKTGTPNGPRMGSFDIVGTTPTASAMDTSYTKNGSGEFTGWANPGWIKWDPSAIPEKKKR